MVNTLDIYREGAVLATIDIDESTVYNGKLQGTKAITCQTLSVVNIPIQKEDYIIWETERYTLNTVPELGKDGAVLSKDYKMIFEAAFYHLLDWFVEKDGAHIFPYYATARQHLQMIIDSANSNSSGWALGEVDDTEEFLINYDWHYVRSALDEIATAAKLEYEFTGKTLRMVASVGRDTGLVFKVGRGQGLHKIQRSQDTSKSSVNRVWGIGGTKNIDASYRGGLEPNLVFEERYVQTPEVTAWLAGTGPEVRIKEIKYTNEELYPHFLGAITVTTVQRNTEGVITSATFVDPTINFDINTYLLPGTKATVSFLTGSLTGLEFEISNFNYSTKTTTLIPNTDANGYVTPNDLNLPEVGDKYTYLNIKMPAEYYATWEGKLKAESEQYLTDNEFDRLLYGIEPDPHNLRLNQIRLKEGDRVGAEDTEMEVDEILRIVDITYPLVNPYKVTALIGNEIIYDKDVKPYADALAIRQQVQQIDRRGAEIAKRNSQNLRVLADSIFDADGNFDATKFNVGVLSALLGIFGLQSADFLLNKVFITANYNSDVNAVNISAGELIHMEYTYGGTNNVWQMQPLTQSGLVPGSKYYVYSKISTTSNAGSFLVTTDQLAPNANPGFYTLRTGLIYPVNGGYRDADFTYGITSINGRQIRTGIIEGNTGALSLNLDTGEIFGKLTFRASNGSVKDVATVDNKAALADANALAAQITADTAHNQSAVALAELADIADDGILDTSEKVTELKNYRLIEAELTQVYNQGLRYGVTTTDYQSKFNALQSYIAPLFANMSVNTPIDRTVFINKFKDYYTARQAVYDAIANATKALVDNISVGGRNYIRNSNFYKGLTGWTGNYGNEVLSMVSGKLRVTIGSTGNSGVYTGLTMPLGDVTYSAKVVNYGMDRVFLYDTSSGAFSDLIPGQNVVLTFTNGISGLRYFVILASGTTGNYFEIEWTKAETGTVATDWTIAPEDLQEQLDEAIDQSSQALAELADISNDGILDVSEKAIVSKDWNIAKNERSLLIAQASTYSLSTTDYTNALDFVNYYSTNGWGLDTQVNTAIDRANFNFVWEQYYTAKTNLLKAVTDAANGKINTVATNASADATAKANAALAAAQTFADSIATSKANIAQANSIGAAQTDAQGRADEAYNNAVSASNTYAATVANSASSAAQIAAAADASNKATQAYNDAVSVAQTQYNSLTNSLKSLAYQDLVQLAKLGDTVIENGMIKTTLLNVQAIWANIINAGYITAQQIEALNIAVTNLQAVSGTIGGLTITNNSITSSNGNFGVTSAGALTAKSGTIGGFSIDESKLYSGDQSTLNANFVNISPGSFVYSKTGASSDHLLRVEFQGASSGQTFAASLVNSVPSSETNTSLVLSARNSTFKNVALNILSGEIVVGGSTGFSGYELVSSSGPQTRKYICGVYMGIGIGSW